MKRLTILVGGLMMTACGPLPIEDTPQMQACIARGVAFYQNAPNFPYMESKERVEAGYAEKIDDHILDTCQRTTLSYSAEAARNNQNTRTATVIVR